MEEIDLQISPHDRHQSFWHDLLLTGRLACKSRDRGFDPVAIGPDLEPAWVRHARARGARRDAPVVLTSRRWQMGYRVEGGLRRRPVAVRTKRQLSPQMT